MAFPHVETAALIGSALHAPHQDIGVPSSTEPSITPMSESLTPAPLTTMDTPLDTPELEQKSVPKEPMEGHEGGKTPEKLQTNSELLESQLHKFQDRLESLERLQKSTVQDYLRCGNAPLILPPSRLSETDDDEDFSILPRRFLMRDLNDVDEPAGIYIKRAIRSYERELKRLKVEMTRIGRLNEDKSRLNSKLEDLVEKQTAIYQKLHDIEQLEANQPTDNKDPTDDGFSTSPQLIPELNLVEWNEFRLKAVEDAVGPAPQGALFVIDVLKGEPIIRFESPTYMLSEDYKPRRLDESKTNTKKPGATSNIPFPGQAPLAERIRINSQHILKILSAISSEIRGHDTPLVMVRPYKDLAYYDQPIRQKFQQLKDRFGRKGTDSEMEDSKLDDKNANAHVDQDEYTSSPTAYQHLKCLVDFMDGDIYRKLQYLKSDRCQTVTFSDIWYLFRPGLEVIEQTRRQVYRILSISSASHNVISPYSTARWGKDTKLVEETPVWLHCVYIDFDGKNLGPVLRKVKISKFEGEKAVTALEVFPLSFAENTGSDEKEETNSSKTSTLRRRLIERGKKLLNVTTPKHMHYNGLTIDTRDEIDSHVVVDFEEAFLQAPGQNSNSANTSSEAQMPGWMPALDKLVGEPPEVSFEDDKCRSPCCRGENIHKSRDAEQKRNQQHMATLMPNDHQQEPSLMIYPRLLQDIKGRDNSLSDDDFLIMSYRVFGFVLRSRKWAKLDLSHLTLPETSSRKRRNEDRSQHEGEGHSVSAKAAGNIGDEVSSTVEEESQTVFGQLVLPKGHKEMVKALITQHFRDKESTGKEDRDAQQVDIVRGKGKGLIILLHGAPGVGKTTTAEGVAEMFKKPLFQITCGDLGTTASEVEKALETHFSLANKWGCILLLDEADVFLAARSKKDFVRNGLVSVFLRVLEYYAGILFLTTNRVGDFDEAFASRIHISLYYPQLDIDSTQAIFKLNLGLISDRFRLKGRNIRIENDEILKFAGEYFQDNKKEQWNGRQIRNACQTALALAEYRAQGSSYERVVDTNAEVVLTRNDMETVSKAYLEFIKYLNRVRGKDTESWAKSMLLRALEEKEDGTKLKAPETVPSTSVQSNQVGTGPLAQSAAPNLQPAVASAPPIGAPPNLQPAVASAPPIGAPPNLQPAVASAPPIGAPPNLQPAVTSAPPIGAPPNFPASHYFHPQPTFAYNPPHGYGGPSNPYPVFYQAVQQGPPVGSSGPPQEALTATR
ncbi:hypothetical protein F4803DRAFT_204591 [Xylaria telfairii]|nr:hypothetical protein F4803DRAFT_204591 [Xylaria telfairii]